METTKTQPVKPRTNVKNLARHNLKNVGKKLYDPNDASHVSTAGPTTPLKKKSGK
jgi:hypothetical protein